LVQFRELAARRFDVVVVVEPEETEIAEAKPLKSKARRSTALSMFKRNPVAASIVLILFALIVGFLLRAEYWSYRLKREVAAISSQNLPTTLAGASAYYPAPAPETNGFTMLRQAGAVN